MEERHGVEWGEEEVVGGGGGGTEGEGPGHHEWGEPFLEALVPLRVREEEARERIGPGVARWFGGLCFDGCSNQTKIRQNRKRVKWSWSKAIFSHSISTSTNVELEKHK